MHQAAVDIFTYHPGKDVTKLLDDLNINSDILARQKVRLRNLYMIGKADNRNSPQCQFATYILLALSAMTVSVIEFRF